MVEEGRGGAMEAGDDYAGGGVDAVKRRAEGIVGELAGDVM